MPPGKKYSAEEKAKLIEQVHVLKKQGKTQKEICGATGIAIGTLNSWLNPSGVNKAAKKAVKSVPNEPKAPKSIPTLSPKNPMLQAAIAHERLIQIDKQIKALATEKAKLVVKLEKMMGEAIKVCPGMKAVKK